MALGACRRVERGWLAAPGPGNATGAVCSAERDAVRVPTLWTFQTLNLVALVRPPTGGAVLASILVGLFESKLASLAARADSGPGDSRKEAWFALGLSWFGLKSFFGTFLARLDCRVVRANSTCGAGHAEIARRGVRFGLYPTGGAASARRFSCVKRKTNPTGSARRTGIICQTVLSLIAHPARVPDGFFSGLIA